MILPDQRRLTENEERTFSFVSIPTTTESPTTQNENESSTWKRRESSTTENNGSKVSRHTSNPKVNLIKNKYEIVKKIGKGGQAIVYSVIDLKQKRRFESGHSSVRPKELALKR